MRRSPTLASRFWLRLEAMTGGLVRDERLLALARGLDAPTVVTRATRPEPRPPAERRPKTLSISDIDRLAADPYAVHAARVLRLKALDGLEAEPDAAWRGNHIHRILQNWHERDGGDPARLLHRGRAMLAAEGEHPLLRALWEPRLLRQLEEVGALLTADRADGVATLGVERKGELTRGGIVLKGRIDRIDRRADGTLAVVDYKTGKVPSAAQLAAGYALQLGLCGLLVEEGVVDGCDGAVADFAYWSLTGPSGGWAKVVRPSAARGETIAAEDMVAHAAARLDELLARYVTGDAPFTARLVPQWVRGGAYDQLMRLAEWWGR